MPDVPAALPAPGPLSRGVLILGVAVTAVSFVALLLVLVLYFADTVPHASLYWLSLWGLPIGFVLMLSYVLLALRRRQHARRLRVPGDRR
ncbi:hypothetical protein [Nesterenkonia sp. NBAIMH1]|uniref:hypothetical protein n=1 Tax=Nesterenkonia sp. NBAIMH1 TaxID=2600320 RepID=UPI0011B43461|nr:hypothetical protein [Nesterenkonia sp. NBAIMH1]